MQHVKTLSKGLVAGWMVSAAIVAHAQSFPNRPIELTVPYGAGGATDVVARKFAQIMAKELNASFVVVNRPGAQGTLQMAQLAKAKPDGYTLGFAGYTSITYTAQRMSTPPFNIDDFVFLGEIGTYSYGLVVPASSAIQNLDDYVNAAKTPQGMTYGVTGAPNNMPYAVLGKIPGAKFTEVNYKSGLDAVMAAAGNHVESALQNPQDFIPMIQSGQVRLIASMTDERIVGFEHVPTAKEQGYDVAVGSSIGFAAPAGIPEDVRQTLQAATMKVLKNPEFIAFMRTQHMYVNGIDGPRYTQKVKDGYVLMGNFIKAMNIPMLN